MEENLRNYVDSLFASVPVSESSFRVKAETLGRLNITYAELLKLGKTDEEAYSLAIASLGDIREILSAAYGETREAAEFSGEEYQKASSRNAVLKSVAVALYILSPVPCIIFQNTLGVVLLFVFIAAATGLIIFSSMTKKKYKTYGYEKSGPDERNSVEKAVISALWAVVVVMYFIVSFLTSAWYITWVIFLIGAAADGIVKAIFDLREANS